MTDPTFTIRTATREEINLAVDWAATEGWNPGLHDAESCFKADPGGFLVGMLNDQIIATVSSVRYGKSYGFLGFYIVDPNYRDQGYGLQMCEAAYKQVEGRTYGMDGVLDMQKNYAKTGFDYAFRNIRFEGVGGGAPVADSRIVAASSVPFNAIHRYVNQFFPVPRPEFDRTWLNQSDSTALAAVDGDRVIAYGLLRKCRVGHKVGPLFADTPELAERLFTALKATIGSNEAIFLDTPETNPEALKLANRHDMKLSFETARMYVGTPPDLSIDRTYGITSFEVG